MTPEVNKGILVGLVAAVVQASLTVGLLKWAWNRKSFYPIWAGCTLARFLIVGLMALFIHRFTNLNLAATLLSMVISTMLIMLIEVNFFLKPKK